MKILATILFCLACLNLNAQIIWKSDVKLNWNNFKSNLNNEFNGDDIAAYASCGWEISVKGSSDPKQPVTIEVVTLFNEEKSWKHPDTNDDYTLNHEQKHFDICELFARKFRREIALNIKNSGDYNKKFQKMYDQALKDYKNFQMMYDKETHHGLNKEQQEIYNLRIKTDLEKLKNYAKP